MQHDRSLLSDEEGLLVPLLKLLDVVPTSICDTSIQENIYNFDQISEFIKNVYQISEFIPNFSISTKFLKFYQISEFLANFRIFTKFQNCETQPPASIG